MTLAHPNPHPRLPAVLRQLPHRPAGNFVLMDIGARGASEALYAPLAGQAKVIGFDDSSEEESKPADGSEIHYEHHTTILAGQHGMAKFFKTAWPFASGLYEPNMKFLTRLPSSDKLLLTVAEVELETTTLDRFSTSLADDHIDFIKIDVEGAELDVLRAGSTTLREKGVLGVKTEFWWDPILRGQPSFAELDIFMRASGFYLFDLQMHNYQAYMRRSLPVGRLSADARDWRGRLRNPRPDSARYGQALTGDALYFRDPISDRIAGRSSIDWESARILRLCALFDIFDYGDCAIELLEDFEKRKTTALDFDLETVLNALTPEVRVGSDKSSILSYRKYRSMSEDIRRQMDKEQYSSLGNLD